MGKTAFEKIIESHLLKVLPDGRMVLQLDWVWGHEITSVNAIINGKARGCDVVFNPNRIKTMIDHVNPAKDTDSAIQQLILREWSKEHDIELADVGRNGICHAMIPERGWIYPGEIGIMGDSHTCTHSAFCAFTFGVGTTDWGIGAMTGICTCQPQKVIRVNFIGDLPVNVFAKDLILTLIKKIGVNGATNAVIEFGGSVIDKMSMEGRMTMSNMVVEAGATSGMMMVDKNMLDYFWPVVKRNYDEGTGYDYILTDLQQRFNSDPDAKYDQIIEIDVSNMVPVTTIEYSPENVVNVAELEGKEINQVYLGSCTNGRIEDLRIVASIFRQIGGKVADNVRCIIVPATQYIYERALQEGLIEIFIKAGCYVSGPTCGACLGMSCGVIAPNEVCLSTTNRNFTDRMGAGGMVHLASPATAALSALRGRITEPTIEMCRIALVDCYFASLDSVNGSAIQMTGWQEKPFTMPDYSALLGTISAEQREGIDFSGKVFYLPLDDVNTDQLIPAKYLNKTKKKDFGEHCLEGVSMSDKDRRKLHVSQIIIALENLGCGSSREHAPWALEGASSKGIKCVIAKSFARIFENNMFANGFLCITLPEEIINSLFQEKPEELFVDWENGIINGAGDAIEFKLSEYQRELIRAGGSVGVMLKLASELQKQGKI